MPKPLQGIQLQIDPIWPTCMKLLQVASAELIQPSPPRSHFICLYTQTLHREERMFVGVQTTVLRAQQWNLWRPVRCLNLCSAIYIYRILLNSFHNKGQTYFLFIITDDAWKRSSQYLNHWNRSFDWLKCTEMRAEWIHPTLCDVYCHKHKINDAVLKYDICII